MKSRKSTKEENVGFILIVIGIATTFISMWALDLFGSSINSRIDIIKAVVPYSCMSLGVFGIGYTVSGKKGGTNALLIFGFLLFVAIVLGLILGAVNDLNAI
jgi:hypothetical protein